MSYPGLPKPGRILRLRRKMDILELWAQRWPVLAHGVGMLRRGMILAVRPWLPPRHERRELIQSRAVMQGAPSQPLTGTKILFMTFRAWTSHVAWETTIAQGLRHRGAVCEFFFCGGGLRICEIGWAAEENGRPCAFCAPYVAAMIQSAGFPATSLDDVLAPSRRLPLASEIEALADEDPDVHFQGVALGPLVEASLLWHYRSATLPDSDEVRRARRDYLVGAAYLVAAAPVLLERIRPAAIVMVNGMFFEERIVREAALAAGVRVVSYEVGAQKGTLFFSHDAPAADYDISSLWELVGERQLTESQEGELDAALASRSTGSSLSRRFYARPEALEAGSGRRLIALFTNVSWDTAVTGKTFAFASMFDWIVATIMLADKHRDLAVAIRIHPAEARWRGLETKERAADFIRQRFPELPPNVTVIPPEQAIDSYALMDAADVVGVFSSTVGLEAAARGKPVVVAGKAHYRARGFTLDANNPEDFEQLIEAAVWSESDAARQQRARRYAYLFFCRAMIPFPAVVEEEPSEPAFTFASADDLRPGRDPMLDVICDGIMHGSPFWLEPARADFDDASRISEAPDRPATPQ